jgi:CheY-like chemotaxis protein
MGEITRRARVLVVDDNRLVGAVVARLLEGHEVRVETDPTSAVEAILAGARFDLTLCDFFMPQMRGDEVFQLLSMAAPDMVPGFVYMTAGGHSDAERLALAAAPGGIVLKPFDAERLRELASAAATRRIERPPSAASVGSDADP